MVVLMPLKLDTRVDQEMHDVDMMGRGSMRMAGRRTTYATIECLVEEGQEGNLAGAMQRLADMEVVVRPKSVTVAADPPAVFGHTRINDKPVTLEEHTW